MQTTEQPNTSTSPAPDLVRALEQLPNFWAEQKRRFTTWTLTPEGREVCAQVSAAANAVRTAYLEQNRRLTAWSLTPAGREFFALVSAAAKPERPAVLP